MKKNNLIAHYQVGSSDKVYLACVRQVETSWEVIGKYGRRGRNLRIQVKASGLDEMIARREQKKLFRSKLKRGYKDVEEDLDYDGPVTRTVVAAFLEPEERNLEIDDKLVEKLEGWTEDDTFSKESESNSKLEVEVECVNSAGIEDRFDVGISYVAERRHSDPGMVYVYDKFGNGDKFFSDRFREIVTGDS